MELSRPFAIGGYLGPPSSHDSQSAGAVAPCQSGCDVPSRDGALAAHTAASLAILAGANVRVVQRMLGHASAAMTLVRHHNNRTGNLENGWPMSVRSTRRGSNKPHCQSSVVSKSQADQASAPILWASLSHMVRTAL